MNVAETRTLDSLSNEELDHVSLGLTNAFGASLAGNAGESDDPFFIVKEDGGLIPLSRSLTVSDLWNTAKATCQ